MYILVILLTIGLFDICFSGPDCTEQPILTNAYQCCSLPDLLKISALGKCSSFKAGIDGCLIECMFNSTRVITNDNADKNNFMQLFLQDGLKIDSDITAVLGNNFDICVDKAKAMVKRIPIPPPGTTSCNLYPAILLGCVYYQSVLGCPANKWQNTPECVNIKDYLSNCLPTYG